MVGTEPPPGGSEIHPQGKRSLDPQRVLAPHLHPPSSLCPEAGKPLEGVGWAGPVLTQGSPPAQLPPKTLAQSL